MDDTPSIATEQTQRSLQEVLTDDVLFQQSVTSNPSEWTQLVRDQVRRLQGLQEQVAALEAADASHRPAHAQDQAAISQLNQQNALLTSQVSQLQARLQAQSSFASQSQSLTPPTLNSTPPPLSLPSFRPRRSPNTPEPQKYDGTGGQIRLQEFETQCNLKFIGNADHFMVDGRDETQVKLAYLIGWCTGKASERVNHFVKRDGKIALDTVNQFWSILQESFGDKFADRKARQDLMLISQKENEDFTEFYTKFQTLADRCEAPSDQLAAMLPGKINNTMKQLLMTVVPIPEEYYELCTLLQTLWSQSKMYGPNRSQTRLLPTTSRSRPVQATGSIKPTATVSFPSTSSGIHSGPMDLSAGSHKLSTEEKTRRHRLGLCHYCGEPGHYTKDCPKKPVRMAMDELTMPVPVSENT